MVTKKGLSHVKSLMGQTFGFLTIAYFSKVVPKQGAYWIAKCVCGATVEVFGVKLRNGLIKSCGCRGKSKPQSEIIGKRFGYLTALSVVNKARIGGNSYLCKCDCGKTVLINENQIVRGKRTTCGCRARVLNQEDLSGTRCGFLSIIQRNKQTPVRWDCTCDCGNSLTLPYKVLSQGHKKSCGSTCPFYKANLISNGLINISYINNKKKQQQNQKTFSSE